LRGGKRREGKRCQISDGVRFRRSKLSHFKAQNKMPLALNIRNKLLITLSPFRMIITLFGHAILYCIPNITTDQTPNWTRNPSKQKNINKSRTFSNMKKKLNYHFLEKIYISKAVLLKRRSSCWMLYKFIRI
jgi:hypothetical protein